MKRNPVTDNGLEQASVKELDNPGCLQSKKAV